MSLEVPGITLDPTSISSAQGGFPPTAKKLFLSDQNPGFSLLQKKHVYHPVFIGIIISHYKDP